MNPTTTTTPQTTVERLLEQNETLERTIQNLTAAGEHQQKTIEGWKAAHAKMQEEALRRAGALAGVGFNIEMALWTLKANEIDRDLLRSYLDRCLELMTSGKIELPEEVDPADDWTQQEPDSLSDDEVLRTHHSERLYR